MDHSPIRRALLSVSDKAGLTPLAQALAAHGAEILATGGTARALSDAGIAHREVSAHTGQREILGGRVKTLVAAIHGGILARRDDAGDMAALAEAGIAPIDLVCVNLYPFERTVASGADAAACVENIDIGGPAMIRSAAKNFAHVCVLTSPAQYAAAMEALGAGGTTAAFRRACAADAFAHTAAYDAAIAAWFSPPGAMPETFTLSAHRSAALRYGENPHQRAALYATGAGGLPAARQVQGKALSYNNLSDTDAALSCAASFDDPTVVIVKHGNPCGVASAPTLAQAWAAALRCDPQSAFGGVVAVNRTLDADTADAIAAIFTEVIACPDATADAQTALARKKNLRLLLCGPLRDPRAPGVSVRTVWGGLLAQSRDDALADAAAWRVVTRRQPTDAEARDLVFAARVGKHVMSNAIVYARDRMTVGIGAGQMSRVDSARIAAWKAGEAARAEGLAEPRTRGAVVASDAFFPFADGLDAVIAAGATAVIQPGGSLRDAEVIAAADAAGISMVFSGLRHFRH